MAQSSDGKFVKEFRQGVIPAGSYDPSTRRFSFVGATERPCPAERKDKDGNKFLVREILSSTGCVNLADVGKIKILNAHRRDDIHSVLGSTIKLESQDGQIVGAAEFSERSDVLEIAKDVGAGHISSLSVGYTPKREILIDAVDGGLPISFVTEWEANEFSFVPVPADISAQVRAIKESDDMNPEALSKLIADAVAKSVAAAIPSIVDGLRGKRDDDPTPAAKKDDDADDKKYVNADGSRGKRAGKRYKKRSDDSDEYVEDTDSAAPAADDERSIKDAIATRSAAEQTEITELAKVVDLKRVPNFSILVRQGAPLSAIRNAAWAAWAAPTAVRQELRPPAEVTNKPSQKQDEDRVVPFAERGKPITSTRSA